MAPILPVFEHCGQVDQPCYIANEWGDEVWEEDSAWDNALQEKNGEDRMSGWGSGRETLGYGAVKTRAASYHKPERTTAPPTAR